MQTADAGMQSAASAERPPVSVCVGVRNGIATAARFVGAVRSQTYSGVELVVVDNFSTDGTAEFYRRHADVFLQQGPERSAQRNLAIQRARGEIVVFHSWGDGKDYIKRVIGLPGERISIHDEQVFVDDTELDEPYLDQVTRDTVSDVTLGPDEYYVLGDNRGNSADSRYYGPLSKDHLVGTAFLSLWPPSEFGPLERPEAAHAGD